MKQNVCDLIIPAAICYDFDGTLSPGTMHDYAFIRELDMTPEEFWKNSGRLSRQNKMDNILAYMFKMKEEMRLRGRELTYECMKKGGEKIELFPGVKGWFNRINAYALKKGIHLEHYIISAGVREIIEGTSIAPYFKEIFASSFLYDENNVALWPALSVNYTNKTQFLFRINKGCLDTGEHIRINQHMDDADKPMPFPHMIYIGDGDTDVPSMKVVKMERGYAIAVYPPDKSTLAETAKTLTRDGRADLAAPADYRAGGDIDVFVRAALDKIKASAHLEMFKKTHVIR